MHCWIARAYGGPDVLTCEERPTPTPGAGQIRVQIRAASVSSGDARIRGWNMPRGFSILGRLIFGVTRPRQGILGSDFAGIVTAVGPGVTRFKLGDRVFGSTEMKFGCHADHVLIRASKAVAHIPSALNFAEAASLVFGGVTASQYLRRAGAKAGDSILVFGAGGAVGNAMVQIAVAHGANVVAVASASKTDILRRLGAVEVIDYNKIDPLTLTHRFDIIADTVGQYPFVRCLPILQPGGRHLAVIADLPALLALPRDGKRSLGGGAMARQQDIEELATLAEQQRLRPLIDSYFPFHQLPEAYRRVEKGHKFGSVILLPSEQSSVPNAE